MGKEKRTNDQRVRKPCCNKRSHRATNHQINPAWPWLRGLALNACIQPEAREKFSLQNFTPLSRARAVNDQMPVGLTPLGVL